MVIAMVMKARAGPLRWILLPVRLVGTEHVIQVKRVQVASLTAVVIMPCAVRLFPITRISWVV